MRRAARPVPTVGLLATGLVLVLGACSSGSSPQPAAGTSLFVSASSGSVVPTTAPTTAAATSPYEADPAVQALRAWATAAATAINADNLNLPALVALETSTFVPLAPTVFQEDAGLTYPGPVPFTPATVQPVSATMRDVNSCFVATGYARNRTTGQPAAPRTVVPLQVEMVFDSGSWKVNHVYSQVTFSCDGVTVT